MALEIAVLHLNMRSLKQYSNEYGKTVPNDVFLFLPCYVYYYNALHLYLQLSLCTFYTYLHYFNDYILQ